MDSSLEQKIETIPSKKINFKPLINWSLKILFAIIIIMHLFKGEGDSYTQIEMAFNCAEKFKDSLTNNYKFVTSSFFKIDTFLGNAKNYWTDNKSNYIVDINYYDSSINSCSQKKDIRESIDIFNNVKVSIGPYFLLQKEKYLAEQKIIQDFSEDLWWKWLLVRDIDALHLLNFISPKSIDTSVNRFIVYTSAYSTETDLIAKSLIAILIWKNFKKENKNVEIKPKNWMISILDHFREFLFYIFSGINLTSPSFNFESGKDDSKENLDFIIHTDFADTSLDSSFAVLKNISTNTQHINECLSDVNRKTDSICSKFDRYKEAIESLDSNINSVKKTIDNLPEKIKRNFVMSRIKK